jgi:hypothetical protein
MTLFIDQRKGIDIEIMGRRYRYTKFHLIFVPMNLDFKGIAKLSHAIENSTEKE